MKAVWAAILFTFTLLSVAACGRQSDDPAKSGAQSAAQLTEKPMKFGIVQIVEHSALDAAREGFIAQMVSPFRKSSWTERMKW